MAKKNFKSEKAKVVYSDDSTSVDEILEESDSEVMEEETTHSGEEVNVEIHEESAEIPESNEKIGTVNCARLNVRVSPMVNASVVCVLDCGAKVSITDDSDDVFYNIYTETGICGYCMKKFITVEE